MREESHLDEMRSAIRGDFERLAERRGEQGLMRVDEDGSELEPDPAPEEPAQTVAPEGEQPEAEPRSELETEPGAETGRRSWLSRLLDL